tara:strand:- start:155 stop:433 length:279 start_codon:yes stop_codon:yes gene_type:complete
MIPAYDGATGLYDDFKTWIRHDPNEILYPYNPGISAPATLPSYRDLAGSPADFAAFSDLSNASVPPEIPIDPALLQALLTGGTLDQRKLRVY